ncbi:MAG: FtsH protease activity modulator HflK, partial [Betaproteobacteria bacterium]|nr:FtsH protease activity modulator HflK [Betaproteobacteria bacterium]
MSLNDPNWGKRPGGSNQGPPDLDEVWRNFQKKLNGLFGNRGGGPGKPAGESGPPISPRNLGGGALVLAALIAGVWLASGFYIVSEGQKGAVLRFGKFAQLTEPGLRWHLPYPIESRQVVNVSQVRSVEVGYRNNVKSKVLKESLMLTDDENIVDAQFAVQYVLKSARDYLFENRSPDDAVLQAAETAIREVVGKSTMDFVVQQGRAEVGDRVQKLMQTILDRYKTGVQIQKVNMQNAQPPERVQAAFEDAVKAGQDRERQKNEGEAYANDVVPKAKGVAARLVQEAEAHRERVVQEAMGDAERFNLIVVEYKRAPQVTRDRLYLDAMQQIMTNTTKIVVEKGSNNLMYLPLDKIMQMAGAPPQAAAAAPPPVAAP